ncbi:hypothetical protein QJQ45_022185, partial [Haematococcus lacustris]
SCLHTSDCARSWAQAAMAFRMPLGLSSVIALLMLTAAAPGPDPGPAPPVALLLHLSDLHLSRFSGDGGCSREADLKALAQGLLSVWRPDALLITGDLTHAKTPYGQGQQQQAEWQAYQRVWRLLAEASGLGPEQVLEQRGNHDTFDAPRGGPLDLLRAYSATAARTAGQEGGALGRVVLDTLLPSQAGGGEAAAGSGVRGGVAGVLGAGDASAYLCGHLHTVFGDRLHRLHDKPDGQAGGGGQRAYLAELMAADWKSARALRLITLDPQAGLSFTDLRFVPHRPDKGDEGGVQVRAVDGSRRVGRHLPLITAPPDARYSALAARPSVAGSAAQLSSALRVLLLPLEPDPPAGGSWPPLHPDQGGLRVWADWRCSGPGRVLLQGSLDCQPLAEQPWLWGADLGSQGALAGCRGRVELQASQAFWRMPLLPLAAVATPPLLPAPTPPTLTLGQLPCAA